MKRDIEGLNMIKDIKETGAEYFIMIENPGFMSDKWEVSKWRSNQGSGIDRMYSKKDALNFAKGLVKLYKKVGREYFIKMRIWTVKGIKERKVIQ